MSEDYYNHPGRCDYAYFSAEDLLGRTFIKAEVRGGDQMILLHEANGGYFAIEHHQDCCEDVYIESIVGDLQDLVGTPITMAEQPNNFGENDPGPLSKYDQSYSWSFFKLATVKGYVDIRFYGSSNGYYSETANVYYYPPVTEVH